MKSHPDARFHGTDVDQEAVGWCRAHLAGGEFGTNAALPPLPYAADSFDIVYSVSVFTHLSEPMQDSWLEELHRILRPGGLLIITVHGGNAARRLSTDDRERLLTSGFLHKTSGKLAGLVPEWYHTTWHSREYIVQKLSGLFDKVQYVEVGDGMQDCIVALRRHSVSSGHVGRNVPPRA